ncbi:MAG TPA: N-acetylmuramic acid 6-phosphate etherase [Firmicutes bacterium]|nr:N-acetylmuramic acid 6-phosphate etherase [Bacillota bacterium]
MEGDLQKLTTECRSPYHELDMMSIPEILEAINSEDRLVPAAVAREIPQIARAVEMIVPRLRRGGRLFYVGAGTSGRLGVLDASECPPTFGVDWQLVQGLIAGGEEALRYSIEGAEDDEAAGASDLEERQCGAEDVVMAISASGRTPYCLGALRYAATVGAGRIALVCNQSTPMHQLAEVTIAPLVGPEVLSGSTRMKAGTAQKLVLNMISTTTMIKLGKVYSNLMVDMVPSNSKLTDRAARIVMAATGCDRKAVEAALAGAGGETKTAIVMLLAGCTPEEARRRLAASGGFVRAAVAGAGPISL